MKNSLLGHALGILAMLCSATSTAGLFGPGKFEIAQADARFSSNQNQVWTSENNRISKKSIAGGVHIDATGVFVNPMVVKEKDTGKVMSIGLAILNRTSYDTTFGSPNSLGAPKEIIFLVNESKPISLSISSGDSMWADSTSYNTVTKSASKAIAESGMAPITAEQYQEIISATSLAVRIVGDKRSVTYEAKDIASSFVPNLKTFFEQTVQQ